MKRLFKDLEWLRVYNSPFKPPIPKLYFGKIRLGVPYFFPRKWVKLTYEEAVAKAEEKGLPDSLEGDKKSKVFDSLVKSYMGYLKAVPKKVGFDIVPMRWKTKFSDTDYRFETGPIWSFVFYGTQIAITFKVKEINHYWECWLYYRYSTDRNKTTKQRLKQARKGFPCVWTTYKDGVKTSTCYWDLILKNKYK